MSLEKFIEDFEEAIEDIEPGSVQADTNYRELEAWDSLAVLMITAMVDAEYGVRINAEILKGCETVSDLYTKVVG